MRQKIDPELEFDWGPVLWVAGTMIAAGLVANFVFMRPAWLGYAAFFAGVVASLRSGFYQQTGHNAVVGTLLGLVVLTPVLAYMRVVFFFGVDGARDTLFNSVALAGGWLIIVFIALLPVAYIGAIVGDFTRKKVGGPIGYRY